MSTQYLAIGLSRLPAPCPAHSEFAIGLELCPQIRSTWNVVGRHEYRRDRRRGRLLQRRDAGLVVDLNLKIVLLRFA